jgi:2-furoyl-CoA dehydrogenase large subunit
VTVATAAQPWVGRALPRLEDEALLRGEGRFVDDLDPVPNVRHAAILRSLMPHARIRALDASAALEVPGVVGVLTGADVAAMSRPFPAGIDSGVEYLAAAREVTRYAGEPLAVVVADDRYVAEDAVELIQVDYEPLEPVLDVETAVESDACVHDRSFAYGDVDAALSRAELVVLERFRFPRWSCTPVECYGVICDWDEASGTLTAWSNFQGPFTLHSVAAAALRLPGSKLRLITPRDSGGSFGIKSAVYAYVVLIGLAARRFGVPVRWTEDRLEHLAASSASTARVTELEAGFDSEGKLLGLRYDAIEDVGAYVRAPEPATLACTARSPVRTPCRTWPRGTASC